MKENIKRQFLDFFYALSPEEATKIVKGYDKGHKTKLQEIMEITYASDMEERLTKAGVNSTCPFCNSKNVIGKGRTTHFKKKICNDCGKSFTVVTNTFMDRSKFSWKAWVSILEMTINGYSLSKMKNVLEKEYHYDGITDITLLLAIHKLLNAIYQIPQPTLTGNIFCDETFFRENQKATKSLQNYIPTVAEYRKPRYGKQPSLLGTMGSEFANVPVAIDSTGHMVAKVACLGRLTIEVFTTLFHDHISNPAYICTDANPIYARYCRIQGIPHYIRPSDYYTVIQKAGYDQPLYPNAELNDLVSARNQKILEKLYNSKLSDRIENKGYLTFKEFVFLKKTYGLNLGAVNKQHSELKKFINTNKTGVSTKYLDKYINFYTFLHNWQVDHDNKYPSSTVDAEEILIYILKNAGNSTYTLKDFYAEELTLPKPTNKYIDLLATMTSEARKEFNNKYLKFNEEDKVYDFKKRDYLLDCPRAWLEEVAKRRGIPYSHHSVKTWDIVNNLLKQDDIDLILVQLLLKEKKIHLQQEDCDLLEFFHVGSDDLGYNTPINEDIAKHYPPVREDSPLYNPNAYLTGQQFMDFQDGDTDDYEGDGEDTDLPF